VYQMKAIGTAADDFEARLIAAVTSELASASELDFSVRSTPGGRHVAVTLDITVQSADQVRLIYSRVRELPGLLMLL